MITLAAIMTGVTVMILIGFVVSYFESKAEESQATLPKSRKQVKAH